MTEMKSLDIQQCGVQFQLLSLIVPQKEELNFLKNENLCIKTQGVRRVSGARNTRL